jgi:hypothetical protein
VTAEFFLGFDDGLKNIEIDFEKIKNLTELEKNILENTVVSTQYITGKKKYALSIGENGYNKVIPLHGSNQQGTFQYSEKFLKEIFNK